MKLKTIWGVCALTLATWLLAASTAGAATSPTANSTSASNVTSSSATLLGSVNPNGAATTYHFEYGPTSALGTATSSKSAGSGTKAVSAAATVSGLQSGTTYYFDVVAQSAAGQTTSRTVTFKTNGPAPAQATTGPATVASSSSATLTGVVNTNGATTTYYFEIGTAAGTYTLQTIPQTLTGAAGPVPVALTVNNLSRDTTFHYVLVAANGANSPSAGVDATFQTFPNPKPKPKVTQITTPHTDTRATYVFSTLGQVRNTTKTPDSLACAGTATIAFYSGTRRVFRELAALSSNCTFAATTSFRHLPVALKRGQRSEKLLVYVRFDGNGYLAPVALKPETVTLG